MSKDSTIYDHAALVDWIIRAFRNLGGSAHLSKVYEEVRRLGYKRGGKDLDKLIRKRIYEYSSDSSPRQQTGGQDVFRRHGEKGSGVWGLRSQDGHDQIKLPEEVPSGATYREGSVQRILVNRYERDPRARDECISHYGTMCFLCGFDFVAVYGEVMAGFTHVHHVQALSCLGVNYEVDPIRDLRPVCPNCHAVLHRREPPFSLDEVRDFLRLRRKQRRR
jgi:predicted HNH restriction endonuclease